MTNYYDNWRTDQYDCKACNWQGFGAALIQGELSASYFELVCPECEELVTLIMLPTLEESRANWDKLSQDEREHVEAVEHFQNEFENRKLSSESLLPDIEMPSFILHWDFVYDESNHETLIKHGDVIIFREPVFWEGYPRFIEVAKILRGRYGAALCDLVPTEQSEMYLYGDSLSATITVDEARNDIFCKLKD